MAEITIKFGDSEEYSVEVSELELTRIINAAKINFGTPNPETMSLVPANEQTALEGLVKQAIDTWIDITKHVEYEEAVREFDSRQLEFAQKPVSRKAKQTRD